MKRSCDECAACCTWCPVEPLGKPFGVRCQHLAPNTVVGGQCTIYSWRPAPCAVYRCSWHEGRFADAMRPDRCGVLFETTQVGDGKTVAFTLVMGVVFDPKLARPLVDEFDREAVDGGDVIALASPSDPTLDLAFGSRANLSLYAEFIRAGRRGEVVARDGDGVERRILPPKP